MKKTLTLVIVILLLLLSAPLAEASWDGGHVVMGTSQGKTSWYFAEGCTRAGYNTYLCIYNPGASTLSPSISYFFEDGTVQGRNTTVDPYSRTTVYVNEAFYGEHDVGCRVTCSSPVVVERSVYFDSNGRTGGHVAMGVGQTQQTWYFAEGCTQPGFDEWVCLLNPSDTTVTEDIQYMSETGEVASERISIASNKRFTRNVRSFIGDNKNISVKIVGVTTNDKVVAERPMYFNYQGKWDGGHNAVGTNTLSLDWYFGEGCTRSGFDTWLTIQNPNSEPAAVEVTYRLASGQNVEKKYPMLATSRKTVSVASDVGSGQDVSIWVRSNVAVAAERSVYFFYRDKWDGGSDSFGATTPQTTWLFAEGCSRGGFETWLTIQNPNNLAVDATVVFSKQGGGQVQKIVPVAANSRVTIDSNLAVGPDCDFSTIITSALGLVVERPMYFDYAGKGPNLPPPPTPTPTQGPFVGSKNSNVYHWPSCSAAQNILPQNLRYFANAQEAVNAGYHPCAICNPPLP